MACELCDGPGGAVLWRDERCRVVHVEEAGYPGFCRVIWNAHVSEMTDLAEDDRAHLMKIVYALEAALRERLQPDKINLASLGNMTPHLHWHVIPRFRDDPHFPNPIWGAAQRPARAQAKGAPAGLGATLAARLAEGGSTRNT
jgi:diadenosine tetraphosphate (Ap4A) HIT family hydrolase